MRLDRAKNTARNIAVGYLSRIILLFFPFVTRNVFIRCLGEEFLGLNSLFGSILSALNMAELGFGSAIIVHMYRAIAADDDVSINALLGYYKRIYHVVGLFIFCAGCILIPFLPKLIQGSYPNSIQLTTVYLIYLFNTVISYFLFAHYSSLISAFQRTDILTGIDMAVKILMYLTQIGLLLSIRNYYAYLTIMPVFTILNNIWTYVVARKKFPKYFPEGMINTDIRADIIVKVKGAVIGRVSAMLRNTFDSIYISAFLGLTATAIYGNYYYILETISSLLLIIPAAATGGAGNSIALDSQTKNYKDMNRMNFLYMWLAGWCATCMLCMYQRFMLLWMGEHMLLPLPTMVLFSVYLYVMKIGDVLAIYSGVKGLYWERRFITIAEALANMLLNYFLGKYFGISGILWATLISMVGINFLWGCRIVFKYYFTEYDARDYIMRHMKYGCTTAVIAIITYGVCRLVRLQGFLGLLAVGSICVVLPNVLYYIIYCRTESFKDSIPWFFDKLSIVLSKKSKKKRGISKK